MEHRDKEILMYYDSLALEYDRRYRNPELNYMHSVEDEFLLKELTSGVVLDIGCGTGRQSILLAKNGFKTIGIDISKEMIEIARAKAAEEKIANVDFVIATTESLPLKTGCADSAISIFGALNHIPGYMRAFEEIARTLKPGGACIFTVVNRWNLNWWVKCFFMLKWKWLLTAICTNEHSEGIVWTHYYSAGELKRLFREHNFNIRTGALLLFFLPKFGYSDKPLSAWKKGFARIENKLRWRYPFNRMGYYILGAARKQE